MAQMHRRTFPLGLFIQLGIVSWLVCVIALNLVGQHFIDSAMRDDDVVRRLHQLTLVHAFVDLRWACLAAPTWIVAFAVWLSFRRGQARPASESMQETSSGSHQRSSVGSRWPRIVALGITTAIFALLLTLAELGAALAGMDGLSHSIGFFTFPLNALVFIGFPVLGVVSGSRKVLSRTTDADA